MLRTIGCLEISSGVTPIKGLTWDYSSINTVQRYETEATQPDLNQTWQAKYEAISRANATLRLASQAKDISAADLKRIQGETRFERSFYFDLKKIWNSVPYIDETKDYGTGIEKYLIHQFLG